MSSLALRLMLLRGSGWVRPLLVVATTAYVSAVALVAVAVVQLPRNPMEQASNLLMDPGVRPGYVFALVLVCLGPLGLLYQAIRLGSADRERRRAALRLAGATPREVRALGAFEVGLPALLGGALGWPGYLFLRTVAGGEPYGAVSRAEASLEARVVPVSVAPSLLQASVLVLTVGAVGAIIGARAVGRAAVDPLGESRQVARRAPRPWSLLLLLPAGVIGYLAITDVPIHGAWSTVMGIAFILLVLLALLGLGSTCAHLAGRIAVRHSRSAVGVLAGARLLADPRATGRAGATAGGIGLAAGVSSFFLVDLERTGNGADWTYLAPLALEVAMLVFTLLVVAMALGVHGAETAMDRRRAFAALVAQGVTNDDLVRAHGREISVVVLPLAGLGVVLGSVPATLIGGVTGLALLLTPLTVLGTIGLTWIALLVAEGLARPAITRACTPDSLRTP